VLAIGAHCDDIEIGAGATILEWTETAPVEVAWVVMTSTPARDAEAHEAATHFLASACSSSIKVHDFRDGFLPYTGAAVKEAFEALRRDFFNPDVILTHHREDRHQDHRLVSELTWNTYRDHFVLEYEIPKYDGDLTQPNSYVPIAEDRVARKWAYLNQHFVSQRDKPWFTEDTFRGLMRIRGIEARAASGFAEAFAARKVVLGMPGRMPD